MAKRDRTYLKSRFENGDTPDQNDFADLIDSFFLRGEGSASPDRVSRTADGPMPAQMFQWLGAGETQGSTANSGAFQFSPDAHTVKLSYPNWATGESRSASIPAATASAAGCMSAADKTKLDAIPLPESIVIATDRVSATADGLMPREMYGWFSKSLYEIDKSAAFLTLRYPNYATGEYRKLEIPAATADSAGLMTAADKLKLDSLIPATDAEVRSAVRSILYPD